MERSMRRVLGRFRARIDVVIPTRAREGLRLRGAPAAHYIRAMNDRVYFADVELPFHVWVREDLGGNAYRWVLRDTRTRGEAPARSESSYADHPQDEPK